MKFLITDDDYYMSRLIGAYLKKDNSSRVVAYSHLSDGIRHMMEERFDCVVLDLHMPGMSGLDAIPVIREITPDVIVGIVSSDASAKEKAIESGADFFLKKPDEIAGINELVKDIYRKHNERRAEYGKNSSDGRV